ncbi:MAG: PAS domain S-box protein [Terriglobales bacterium]|jgi:PAS domain S-box-containing protein
MIVSANAALTGSYDYGEVARSILIAIAASYAALDLAGRVTAAKGWVRLAWLNAGATAMGIGIWEMHFKGMLAFRLPVPVEYHWPTILAALVVAILASAVALYVVSRQEMGPVEAWSGSIIMGVGIAGLHYLCMASMRLPAITRYSPLLVTLSILFAMAFSLIALLLVFGLREETKWSVPRRLGGATVMGVAVSGMHYTGMAAASFIPASLPDLSHAMSISPVANNGIAVVTLIVIAAALTTSSVDRRASAEVQRLNQELEHRVAERTLQLEAFNQALRKEIVERERAEKALRESEDRLRLVIDTIPQQIWSGPPDGSLDFCNAQMRSYVGLTQEDLQGEGWQVMLHPEDRERVLKVWREAVMNGTPFEQEVRHRGADGQYRWFLVRGVPLRDSAGRIVRWYGTSTDIEDRKRAEDELRKQKEVFQKIFDHIPVTISFVGQDGHIELVNPEWERTIGWTLEEIRKQNLDLFAEFYPDPQYRQWVLDLTAASTGEWTDRKVRVRDGRVIDLAMAVVHLSDGTSIAIGRDITERKRAEEALRTSERRQHKIAKQLEAERARLIEAQAVAKVGSWETELPSLEVSWSEQTHRIFETDPSQFHPSRPDFVEFIHPEDRAKVDAVFQASLDKRAPSNVEYRIVMADGRVKVLEEQWRVFHDEQGRPIRLMGTCRDITERKRTEAELRESEARFRLVADSAPVMIWMSGTDKLRTYFNKPWLDFTGQSFDHELGNGWADGVHPEDLRSCMVTYIQAFDGRQPFRMEYRLRHDSEYRWVSEIGVPRFNPDGSFAGYIGSCIDVTEQRRAEEQLHQAQAELAHVTRAVTMGELVASLAHEVNQPLTAVITTSNFALRQLASGTPNLQDLQEAIKEIVDDATRISAVISQVRSLLSKKGGPDRVELNINDLIQEVTVLLRNEAALNRVQVRLDLAADLPFVLGDRVQLQQVLINLAMNGIEAMHTVNDRPRRLSIKSVKHADGVLIQVQDSGIGFDPDLLDRIFEPFFTTKPEGIGMGLSISRSIVESHGGRLWAESGPNGALFQLTLPAPVRNGVL